MGTRGTEQAALRTLLGVPAGPPGLGITMDGDRLHFEFAADNREVKITAAQLRRRLEKLTAEMD